MIPSGLSLQFLEAPGVVWIALTIALLVGVVLYYRGGRANRALLALRVLACFLVAMLLLDPVLSRLSERSLAPRIALLLDTSLSMSIPDPEEDPAAGEAPPTRAERLAAALRETDLVDRLEREGEVETYRFGADLTPVNPGDADALVPHDDRTDLSRALSGGVGTQRRRTGAVIVATDGSHNVGVEPRGEARRLGVPVWTVGVGSPATVNDLSIAEVEASQVAYLENRVPVVARVRARGDSALSVPVYLSEGDAVLDSVVVELPGGGAVREVELEYVPNAEGLHRYRVWTPSRAEEISDTNNEQLLAVRVLKEKVKVLLVTSRLSYDFEFLKRALDSDISLDVHDVVLALSEFRGRLGREEFPATYPDLATYDLVVLLEMGGSALSRERADMIARYVQERGGALLVAGSPAAFDLGNSPLAPLLPFDLSRPPRSRTGQILPALTQTGRVHPVTRLESDADENARRWSGLPPLSVAPVFVGVKPEARVLVLGAIDGAPRDELPLVATVPAGRGRVLTLGGSPFWRWDLSPWGRGRTGDVFARLVTRSARWLVARDDLESVIVRPARPLFDGADPVVIEGQVFDDDFRPVAGADVRASIRGPLGTVDERTREMTLVDLGEGRYRGQVPALPPGDYRVDGTATTGGQPLGDDTSEMTVAPYRMEFENPSPDFALLRDVGRESGGGFVPLADLADLPKMLQLEPVVERSSKEMPLLENPALFLLLLALLGGEWALRRRRGLP